MIRTPQPTRGVAFAVAALALALAVHAYAQEEPKAASDPAAAGAPPAPPKPDPGELLEGAIAEQAAADKDASASQERVNGIDDETQKLLAQYRQAKAETESIKAYTDQLSLQLQSQLDELDSIQRQLLEVETTAREVVPLTKRMLDTLKEFVALDTPFLIEERRKRVATLEEVMNRADVTVSEKYRRVVEAYQIEMEYGRTLEAYEGKLGEGADARTVQFLRVGRVALLYQTIDGSETGYWDADKRDWVVDDHYRHAFQSGLAIAKKMSAPDLLVVPVHAAKESAS
jgi:hypothetical protein